jgi:hypothetical protein
MKHYRGCPGAKNHCRCDEVDPTLRLSPEAQLDAIYEAEHLTWLREDGGPDPAVEWDGCPGCGQHPRYCACPFNYGGKW